MPTITRLQPRIARPFCALLLFVSSLLFGCASAVLPPALTPTERTVVDSTHFAATVGVESYDFNPAYSDRLALALQRTGLFDDVRPLDELPNPDLIARVERHVYGTATILPVITLLTLGVIPTWIDEEWGEVFSLRTADSEPVQIDFTFVGPSVGGWAAAVMNLSPNRTSGDPRETPRFTDAFASELSRNSDQIRALLKAGRAPQENRRR